MNYEAARLAMVESQIRPYGVRDARILEAFASLPRELFVGEDQKPLAYCDEAIPVAIATAGGSKERRLLPPMVLARMLQHAAPRPSDRALDIGGVTGYSAAILSRLCGEVHALETDEGLAAEMRRRLSACGIDRVQVHCGPLDRGWEAAQPYDIILLNGAVAEEPEGLFPQLSEGGRLLAIWKKNRQGHVFLFTKSHGVVSGMPEFDAGAEFLPGFEAKPHFVF